MRNPVTDIRMHAVSPLSDSLEWAVIDIGSNSVRLVMYQGPLRAPVAVVNEKVLCALGDVDPRSGALRQEAVDEALRILRRFSVLTNDAAPRQLFVFATAAARDACNGAQFLAAVREIGFEPLLLSGDEEARLAALGILSGAPELWKAKVDTLVGDIGGGSLELCQIKGGMHSAAEHKIGERISLPLGGLRLSSQTGRNFTAVEEGVSRELDAVPWLQTCAGQPLYAVGGAWRALGRIEIAQKKYPLDILDAFFLSRQSVQALVQQLWASSDEEIAELPGAQRRRAATLPHAALLLERLLDRLDAPGVYLSSSGVREGVLFDHLSVPEQSDCPVLSLARATASSHSALPAADGCELVEFIQPVINALLPNNAVSTAVHLAALLSCTCLAHHPDLRPQHSAHLALGLPFRGLLHGDRVLASTILFARYGGTLSRLERTVPADLLSAHDLKGAWATGLALRLALELCPTGHIPADDFSLILDPASIRLMIGPKGEMLWNRGPQKRLDRLADVLGLSASVTMRRDVSAVPA